MINDFDKIAPSYDRHREPEKEVLDTLLELFKNSRPRQLLLDIGCGTGRYSIDVTKRFRLCLVGIDISREMIRIAKTKLPMGIFIRGKVEDMISGFKPKSFDYVLSCQVLHLVDRCKVFPEIRRILRDQGKLVIITFDQDQFCQDVFHRYIPHILAIDLQRYPGIAEIRKELEEMDFNVDIIKVRCDRRISNAYDVERLVKKGKARFFSTLAHVDENELSESLEKMRRELMSQLKKGSITQEREHTIVVGRKLKKEKGQSWKVNE